MTKQKAFVITDGLHSVQDENNCLHINHAANLLFLQKCYFLDPFLTKCYNLDYQTIQML